MDPVRFDTLTRVLGQIRGRRGVVALIAALPLGGVLTGVTADDAAAERPGDRLQRRSRQRNQKQRNSNKNNNNKKKNKNKGGGRGGSQCAATGSDCNQDSDCCSNNCFNLGCADKVHSCGANACHPAANGCVGDTCCHGAAVCGNTCCAGTANQCNPQGACCAPNCDGRQCGDDGCGSGGTCGNCPSGLTCASDTGQCAPICGPQNCPHGCCDSNGRCQLGTAAQACGKQGEPCQVCGSGATCLTGGVCRTVAGTCTTRVETCGRGLISPCNSNDTCTCDITVDGASVCRSRAVSCIEPCNVNADCGAGSVCVPCLECSNTNRICASVCSS